MLLLLLLLLLLRLLIGLWAALLLEVQQTRGQFLERQTGRHIVEK